MRKVIIMVLIMAPGFPSFCHGQHADQSKINEELREAWIHSAMKELLLFKPYDTIQQVIPSIIDLPDLQKITYRISGKGYIRAKNLDWIYIISTSGHDNEKVGDVSLAVDNHRKLYLNPGHVCGGIIHFESTGVKEPESALQFFNLFRSDTDNEGWKEIRM